jgi:MFS transporter, LPLT family, lysophospholipid transporter
MQRGFYEVMKAQFFSSLADNALFVVAVALLRSKGAPEWQQAALVSVFAVFYVVLAPVAGALADRFPKGQVMFASNAIKVLGCLMLLFSDYPLIAYSVVGLGASIYGPAKYGILTEMLPPSQLVKANGWIEGLTIGSILSGLALGGALVSTNASAWLFDLDVFPVAFAVTTITTPQAATACIMLVYFIAAAFNLRILRTGVAMQSMPGFRYLMTDFWHCNAVLWRDKLGQISLATTTLFWGAGGPLRYLVIAWGAAALGYGVADSTQLMGLVALGTAIGVVAASLTMSLDNAIDVLPIGIIMGVTMIAMIFVTQVWVAALFMLLLGALGGFLVVPMNALLQHRGHVLMSAGRSIAVQNLNEQLGILVFSALSTGLSAMGASVFAVLTTFGLIVSVSMHQIRRLHKANLRQQPDELMRLQAAARSNKH